jgi:hypothetical protein
MTAGCRGGAVAFGILEAVWTIIVCLWPGGRWSTQTHGFVDSRPGKGSSSACILGFCAWLRHKRWWHPILSPPSGIYLNHGVVVIIHYVHGFDALVHVEVWVAVVSVR